MEKSTVISKRTELLHNCVQTALFPFMITYKDGAFIRLLYPNQDANQQTAERNRSK